MATYAGDYTLDSGSIQHSASLRVFVVEIVLGDSSKFGGNVINTAKSFDANYLPPIFLNHLTGNKACCTIPTNTERHARAYFADNRYLWITCPFRGDSAEFIQFYKELDADPKVFFVEAHGETIGVEYALLFANKN